MALPLLSRSSALAPGPASHTFYHVARCDAGADRDLDFPVSFQSELSHAHSQLFFLRPHALALSVIENKPLLTYFDRDLYKSASLLYPHDPLGPLRDLDRCDPFKRDWTRQYTNEGLID